MMWDFPLTLPQMNFMKLHWGSDMSAYQLSKLFNVPEYKIHLAAKQMKLPEQDILSLQAFCTPFPYQIARNIPKFSWDNYLEGEPDHGPDEARSTDT